MNVLSGGRSVGSWRPGQGRPCLPPLNTMRSGERGRSPCPLRLRGTPSLRGGEGGHGTPRAARGGARRSIPRRAGARPRRDGGRLSRRGPEAPPARRHQAAQARVVGPPRQRAVPPRDRDRRDPPAPPHSSAVRLGTGRWPALLRDAVRRGRVAPAAARPGTAASARRRAPDHPRSRQRPAVRPRARGRPSGHQAGEHHAVRRPGRRRRLRHRPGPARRERRAAHARAEWWSAHRST